MHIPKWLIATAALACVALIAVIAFLLGRDTSRPAAPAPPAAAMAQPPSVAKESAPEESTRPAAEAPAATTSRPAVPAAPSDHSQAADETRARVRTYFEQMAALQSAGTGNQDEFATTIVNAASNGDFSGLDELIRSAGDAERRATALQPPSECAEYHRLAVMLLADSRTMITAIRDGLKRNDSDALTSMAASAQSMKSRADSLAKAEQALRARFGL